MLGCLETPNTIVQTTVCNPIDHIGMKGPTEGPERERERDRQTDRQTNKQTTDEREVYVCIRTYVYMYIYICICMYIHIHTFLSHVYIYMYYVFLCWMFQPQPNKKNPAKLWDALAGRPWPQDLVLPLRHGDPRGLPKAQSPCL